MITETAENFSPPQNKKPDFFLPLLLIFLATSLILLPFFQYHLNPDGICYIRIANYYADGNFAVAVNGYWSPLVCWLLAPLYKIGVPELIGFRLLNIVIACFVLQKIYQIVIRYCGDMPRQYSVCLMISCALELLILHFNTITPDLLTLYLLLFLLEIFLSGKLLQKPFIVGLLGALLYFTKAYSFYFFIAFIFFYTVIIIYKRQLYKTVFLSLIKIWFVFFVMSFCWIIVLHWKYNEWMISSTPAYTIAILDNDGITHFQFAAKHVLNPLPYREAYIGWEDMPWVYKHTAPQAIFYKSHFIYIKLIFLNCKKLVLAVFGKYPFLALFIIPAFIFFTRNKNRVLSFFRWPYFNKIIGFVGLYISGYLLIIAEPRYVWILLITSTIVLFRLLYFVFKNAEKNINKIIAVVAIVPFLLTTVFYVSTRINVNKNEYDLAMKIKQSIPEERIIVWIYGIIFL
jgi:hypothetical protein